MLYFDILFSLHGYAASRYGPVSYTHLDVYKRQGFQDVGVPYSGYSQSIANKSLGWEKSYMTDLGFDLGLFSDRLNVAFDWYRTDTKDILFEKNLPYATKPNRLSMPATSLLRPETIPSGSSLNATA